MSRRWSSFAAAALSAALALGGCASYKGGKAVDGVNLEIGIIVPGTDYNFNLLSYTSGMKVAGNTDTEISVTNEVDEANSYFGVVTTRRHTKMSAAILPCENSPDGGRQ